MRLRQAVDTPLVHLALFVATGLSVAATHFVVFNGGVPGDDFADRAQGAGLFAGCIMLILGAHEMGHWLLSRHHRVDASLPWFIPLPLLGFGTLGAVIRLRGRIPTRNALIDIGAAGPLAGLAIAVPLMISGLLLSHVEAVPLAESRTLPALSGLALLQDLGSWALPNLVPAAPAAVGLQLYGESLLTLVLERLVVGPVPPGHDIFVHPVFLAAWFGLLVTMLNLLPVGQLDGGHVSHALFGARAERAGPVGGPGPAGAGPHQQRQLAGLVPGRHPGGALRTPASHRPRGASRRPARRGGLGEPGAGAAPVHARADGAAVIGERAARSRPR